MIPFLRAGHILSISYNDIIAIIPCIKFCYIWDVTILTEKVLVLDAVWDGRAKWYNIGLQLGLVAGTLDAVRQTKNNDTDECFTAALKEWLRRGDLHPSWTSLAKSLRARSVGLGHLAANTHFSS